MLCHQNSFKLIPTFLLLSLVFTPALRPVETLTVSAKVEPQEEASEHQALDIEKKPQRVFAPHWTTEENFSTTIYIRNVHISQATIARTSLILDHRTIMLPDTFVDSLQTVALDVKKALVESGENPEQSGGAVIDFEAESAGAVNAYAQVLDTTRSLSFSFPFMQDGAPASAPLDAVAWFYSNQTDAFVALQNTREKETTASLTIFVSGRPISLGSRVLKPHEVTTVQIPSVKVSGSNNNSLRSEGVRVDCSSEPGAVVAQGWVVDGSIGFSAPFAFHPKSNCGCGGDTQHKYGTGIMLGRGGMAAPNAPSADIIFSPYLVVRNRSDKPLIISPLFSYEADHRVKRVKLPAINLDSQGSAVVNLREFQEQSIIPSSVEMGDIDLQYEGESGALVAELASVDQKGSFVSPVPLICNGGQASAMSYWRTDGDWHSSVTIENIASQENDLEITVSYPGGIYLLEKRMAAGETTMVSINELQQSQVPDREGRRIPTDATLGGVNIWSRNVHNGLVINAMLMNPVTKTCGQCIYPGYVTAYAVSDKQADPTTPLYYGFYPHPVNQSFSIWLNVNYSMGGKAGLTPSSSSSSNPSVATASQGFGYALNVGTTSITAVGNNFFTDSACSQPGNISSTASLTVVPQVTVNEVGFTGDYQITQWSGGAVIDNPDGSAATWKGTSNPNYPVAYAKGATSTMFATLGISPSASSTGARIRVKNGSTVIATKNGITISGTSVTITGITTTSALETTVKTTTPTFTWEISYDTGTSWISMGNSGPHTMYWTYAAPLSPPFRDFSGATYAPLYDLALQKACDPANGTADIATIVSRINQRVDADIFYDPGNQVFGHPLNGYSQSCLCADLALLLRGLIRSIGIDGSVLYKWGGTDSSTQTKYIIGSIGTHGIDNPTLMVTRSLHDGAPANPHFSYHAVLQVGSTLYDPSYGLSYASLSFAETANNNSTPQQTSTTFPSFYAQSGWVCPH